MNPFDSAQWIDEKKLELINLLFLNEFGIADFQNTNKVINFDELQTEAVKNSINKYRSAMGVLFKTDEIRSILDYYYLEQDKKPALNLLKQILRHYGFEFERSSEYQGNYGGKKVYKSKYTIIPAKKMDKIEEENPNEVEDAMAPVVSAKKKIINKLIKTYNVSVPKDTDTDTEETADNESQTTNHMSETQ